MHINVSISRHYGDPWNPSNVEEFEDKLHSTDRTMTKVPV